MEKLISMKTTTKFLVNKQQYNINNIIIIIPNDETNKNFLSYNWSLIRKRGRALILLGEEIFEPKGSINPVLIFFFCCCYIIFCLAWVLE